MILSDRLGVVNPLEAWIQQQGKRRYKLAESIGMSASGLTRAAQKGTFSIENLLRLAIETGEPASTLFRLADKPDIADLLEQLYGPSKKLPPGDIRRACEALVGLPEPLRTRVVQTVLELKGYAPPPGSSGENGGGDEGGASGMPPMRGSRRKTT